MVFVCCGMLFGKDMMIEKDMTPALHIVMCKAGVFHAVV